LFGNIPAIDVINLKANEGESYGESMKLLFAGKSGVTHSRPHETEGGWLTYLFYAGYGDLRNVVQSLSSLPASYDKPVTMVVNDMDFDVVARNLIMLLILMSLEDEAEAVDCVLHLWYSTMIRQSHLDILKTHIRPLIKKVVKDMHKPASGGLIANTWVFGHCSVRAVLHWEQWKSLLSYLKYPLV